MTTSGISGGTSFTGPAGPYPGGDPYADYRAAAFAFEAWPDLADRRLGAGVIAASDEFFAERENLLTPEAPVFDPAAYGPKGKVMDGWESRRRRGAHAGRPHPDDGEHDWALIRLGVPGAVRGVVVDTAHFRGNHPESVAVEGAALPGTPSPGELLADDVRWTPLVPRTPVGGHAANGFPVDTARRFTHLRLSQFPDGGIARLRVHGEPLPDPAWLAALGTFDLAALEHGGRVEDASDRFFSPPFHSILPGRSRKMSEGWETRRRRDKGHDWVRYRLAGHCVPRAVEIDTGCYVGNAAGWAALSVLDATTGADPVDPTAGWTEVLAPTRLQPDAVHRLALTGVPAATHLRVDIYPDGGIARLRVHGSLTEAGVRGLRRSP
ncbi:allantoicase [Streptomyces cinnamoneus]|uniref:Probable allantoicase n=1 Tax=Streptomyces cinnamoneus TaxID=53446 RepID=A0A2G1XA96_STRCJ|nr:allantoicase [Streptomyces cinnamoneus]PHQ48089.1 allantoicase [Streptomyces cinnamoneus]PPT15715.1 allantoicase [Streptomyces cinnamoneus]